MKRHSPVLLAVAGVLALVYAAEELDRDTDRAADGDESVKTTPRRVLATRTLTAQSRSRPPLASDATYVPDQLMAEVSTGVDAHALAHAVGARVVADHGRDLVLFEGDGAALAALAEHPAVHGPARNAVMSAAGNGKTKTKDGSTDSASTDDSGCSTYTTRESSDAIVAETATVSWDPRQWHHVEMKTPSAPGPLDQVVVAVLDSGVAYADYCGSMPCTGNKTPTDRMAPTLADTVIVAPIDYVAGDYVALDAHQHGTHIATSILGGGDLPGVAPGASLMPVRVLDSHKRGYEFDLIHAIYWAVDKGADVINMSLSFGPGYTASPHLLDALRHAYDHDVLMVAATGNAGIDHVAWPARSPYVIAVGASAPDPSPPADSSLTYVDTAVRAPYSNGSAAVDLLGPGGDLLVDANQDGLPDGILAETIHLRDPSRTGWWFMEGTSQATAMVTGAAVHLLARGATAKEATWALQLGARAVLAHTDPTLDGQLISGVGMGHVDVSKAVQAYDKGDRELQSNPDVRVSFAPYLERGVDGRVRPAVRFTTYDAEATNGQVGVFATITHGGSSTGTRCNTDSVTHQCTAFGEWVSLGDPGGHAWAVQVDGVTYQTHLVARPTGVLYATDALEAVLSAADRQHILPHRFGLSVYWEEGADDQLGDVAASFAFMAGGTGLATSPMGVIATPAAVFPGLLSDDPTGTQGTGLATSPLGFATPDLDAALMGLGTDSTSPLGDLLLTNGTGLATSPLGFHTLTLLTDDLDIDGTGLATSPMGFVPMGTLSFGADYSGGAGTDFVVMDGTALATSPLGLHGLDLLQPDGGGVDLSGVSLDGGVAICDAESAEYSELEGTTVGSMVDSGGFTDAYHRDAASVLASELLHETVGQSTLAAPVLLQPSP